ncbi:MAG: hypothetical protein ACREOR_12135 [Candidatus Binatia bacterium]
MSTQQILIRLPEDIAARLKAVVPPRKRNKFVADLVTTAIVHHEEKLGRIAAAVTEEERKSTKLRAETREWEATIADGIEEKRGANEKPKAR